MLSIVSGVISAVGFLIHPATEDIPGIMSPYWAPAHGLLWVGFTIALIAFVGIYAYQSEKSGALGLVGFVITIIGVALWTGIFLVATVVEPILASQAPQVLEGQFSEVGFTVILLALGVFVLGVVLFGASIVRTKVFPRAAGALLMIGALMLLVAGLVNAPEKIADATGVVFNVGQVWLGYALLRMH